MIMVNYGDLFPSITPPTAPKNPFHPFHPLFSLKNPGFLVYIINNVYL